MARSGNGRPGRGYYSTEAEARKVQQKIEQSRGGRKVQPGTRAGSGDVGEQYRPTGTSPPGVMTYEESRRQYEAEKRKREAEARKELERKRRERQQQKQNANSTKTSKRKVAKKKATTVARAKKKAATRVASARRKKKVSKKKRARTRYA